MIKCPTHHIYLTEAMNKMSEVSCLIEQAFYRDSSYKPLLDVAHRTYKRLYIRWEKNCKRGKKEGWFK